MSNSKERPFQISIIGPNTSTCSEAIYVFGLELGYKLSSYPVNVFSGGMGGFMEAVFKGIFKNPDRRARTISILMGQDKTEGNDFADVIIPTGLGGVRNHLVVISGDIIIAAGGGAGTLSELAFAWQYGKRVLCYGKGEGWSGKLAGTDLDNRKSGLLISCSTIDEIIKNVSEYRKNFDVSQNIT